MIPAVSYLRMSKDSQDTSISAQRVAVAALAKSGGYRIVREYVDLGISGDATEKRVEFQRMMSDVSRGDFKVVLCWDQDRFGRFDPLEAGFWIKPMRDAGIVLVTVAQGKIDWTDFAGRILYTIQQEGKHQFLRDLSRNVNRGKMQSASLGDWAGGAAPYGYQIGGNSRLVIDDEESQVIRDMFAWYIAGESFARIRARLNGSGIAGPRSGPWASATIGKMLKNRAYVGDTVYNRISQARYTTIANGIVIPKPGAKTVINDQSLWIIVENTHPAIVSRETFAAAKAAKKTHKKFTSSNNGHRILFKSLLTCGRCGYSMHGCWVPVMQDVVYVCAHHMQTGDCETNRTYQEPLRALIQKQIIAELLNPEAIAEARKIETSAAVSPVDSLSQLRRQKKQATEKKAKAEARLIEVDKDMIAIVSAQIRELQQKIADLDAAIESASRPAMSAQQEQLERFEARLETYRQVAEQLASGESELLVMVLRDAIERIKVTSVKKPSHGQPNGKYRIKKVETFFKNR